MVLSFLFRGEQITVFNHYLADRQHHHVTLAITSLHAPLPPMSCRHQHRVRVAICRGRLPQCTTPSP
eukprot:271368-Lingulodinium_polyedra.AAC.1